MKKLLVIVVIFVSMSNISNAQEQFLGEVRLFAGNFAPRGWALCHGQLLPISENQALFSILGTTYGGDGRTTFALPDLRGRVAVGQGIASGLTPVKLGEQTNGASVKLETEVGKEPRTKPSLGLNYIIAVNGVYPSRS
jgi:microcystin-dependent protein